jgi:hypothetical protein
MDSRRAPADFLWMVHDATRYALRFGSVIAGVVLFVMFVAPGSRADEATPGDQLAVLREASEPYIAASPAPTIAPPSSVAASDANAPTSVVPTTTAPPTAPPSAAAPQTPRVLSVFDIADVTIDRGATWIAIATVTITDQWGVPAADVDVTGSWSVGQTPASCRTDVSGKCSMYQGPLPADVTSTTLAFSAPQAASRAIPRPLR